MCSVLEISTGSFSHWEKINCNNCSKRVTALKELAKNVYFESKKRCGRPRKPKELQSSGCQISKITVAKFIKSLGLKSKLSNKFEATTDSNHNYLTPEYILKWEFVVSKLSKTWITDITCIQTKKGFLYLKIVPVL